VSGPAHDVRYPYAEYVALEASSNTKHEYLAGQIFAMAGGSPEHAAVTAAVARHLGNQLVGGPCRVYSSDLRVRVTATDLATYPDVTVVCGARRTADDDPHAVVNPVVLVEVLSPSTRDYDLAEKYAHYRTVESLRAYVVVDPSARTIELRARDDAGAWSTREFRGGEHMTIEAVGASLDVASIFDESLDPG
jgi:Uma2 family endonuclease